MGADGKPAAHLRHRTGQRYVSGKVRGDVLATDVELAAQHFFYYAGWPSKIEGATIPVAWPNARVRSERVPVGVVAQILPWNFPLLLAAWKVAPAFAAGCAIVLKPSEVTSLSALWLGQIATEAGLPDGVLNVVPGYGDPAGQALDQPLGVDKSALGLILEPLLGMFNPAPSAGAPPNTADPDCTP